MTFAPGNPKCAGNGPPAFLFHGLFF
jgi:hypothetical protein